MYISKRILYTQYISVHRYIVVRAMVTSLVPFPSYKARDKIAVRLTDRETVGPVEHYVVMLVY